MSKYVKTHARKESECGGFQRVATTFFAAVSPARNALFLSSVKPSSDKSFKIIVGGKQGNLILINFKGLKLTIFQNLASGVHSQNIWKQLPITLEEPKVHKWSLVTFIKLSFLGVKYTLCKKKKCNYLLMIRISGCYAHIDPHYPSLKTKPLVLLPEWNNLWSVWSKWAL